MPTAGAKCWVRGTKKHYGICTGRGPDGELWFVHNTSDGGVVHTTRKGFAGNRLIVVETHAAPGTDQVVVARALSLVGRRYDLLSFNCEHTANLAATGKAESQQVQDGFFWTTLLAAGALLLLNENGTSIDTQGYRRAANGRFATRRWL